MLKLAACFLLFSASTIVILILLTTIYSTSDSDGGFLQESRMASLKGWKPIRIRGAPALPKDDAQSRVDCPRGYYIAECDSNLEGLERFDGIRIIHRVLQGTCIVFNSNLKLSNLTATALCVPINYYSAKMKYFEVNSNEENIDYKCPEGYNMHSCYGLNHWTQNGEAHVLFGPNRCSWEKLWGTIRNMKLTFLCMTK